MVSVFDVAAYILERMGKMTTMKLQKLVYYSQAWSLVWDEEPLFSEDIQAWANGPVVKELFDYHKRKYKISSVSSGDASLLNKEQRATVDAIIEYYGDKSAHWLIALTHMEDPWIQAREGLDPMERGNKIIPLAFMANYYSTLLSAEDEEEE